MNSKSDTIDAEGEHKFEEDGTDDGLWVGGHPLIINGYGVFGKDAETIKSLLLRERIDELKRLKKIDAFNEAYTTDPRPAKLVDIRIQELSRLSKGKDVR